MITSARTRSIFWSALAFSVVLVTADWVATGPCNQWWRERGIQLPGVTTSWLEPMWHVVTALILVGSALLIRVPQFFAVGIRLWIAIHVMYLFVLAMALCMPFIKMGGLHENPVLGGASVPSVRG